LFSRALEKSDGKTGNISQNLRQISSLKQKNLFFNRLPPPAGVPFLIFFRPFQKEENIAVNTLAAKISGQTGKRKKGLFFPYGDSAPRNKMPLSRHALFFLSLCGA